MDASDRARGGNPRADPAPRHAGGRAFRRRRTPSLTLTLEQLSGGALLVDQESRISAANALAARMFGYKPDRLAGRIIDELIPEWAALQDQLDHRRLRSRRVDTRGLRDGGGSFPLRFAQSVVEVRGVAALLVFVDDTTRSRSIEAAAQETRRVLMDITERESSQEELRRSQARLQAAVKAGGIGTWIWELQDDRVLWDDAMYALWGCGAHEAGDLTGAQVGAFVHEEDRPLTRAQMNAFMNGDAEDVALEFRIKRPDGAVQWMSVTGRVERDANGQARRMIGACMDVTARKHAEDAQRHSQKIEALGTLAGGIAHDFNNILLAITGNARLAMADLPIEHPIRRSLVEIDKASARATHLVHRILAFSRQSEARYEIIELRPTIEEALKLLRASLPAMVEIESSFADDLPPVRADSTQIHQIMMNLITNSSHAIGDEAGAVAVAVDTVEVDGECAPARELPSGRYVRMRVSDTGSGMEEATLDRIFDPFFTTKPAGQGTGLGLSVVHGIVRGHGGAITVQSELGLGTTFLLYFPAATSAAADAGEALPAASKGRGQHIMYVDDEDSLVYLTTRMLERLGYEVSGYTDPTKALAAFQQQPHAFDVVVTDISMPGMSGFHFARALLAVRPDIPILMTSGYTRAKDREAAQALGVRDLILKPNTIEELGHSLARLFEEVRKN